MDDVSFDEDETDLVAIMEKAHAQNIAIIQTAHDRHIAEHDRHLAELKTLKAQHFTHIQALELKIFTLEQDLVRSKAMEFELEKEEGGGAGGGKRNSPPHTHAHTLTQDGVLYSDRSEHGSWQSARTRRSLQGEGKR